MTGAPLATECGFSNPACDEKYSMSWIEEADLSELPEIFRAISIDPEALEAIRELNETLAFGNSTLSRVQEEAIATVVSVANRCSYGALTHGGFLRHHSEDREMAVHLLSDYTGAQLSSRDRSMLDFALRITRGPAALTQNDLAELRQGGFNDRDILSIVLVACLINFMNRLASSLGVVAPANLQRMVESWLTEPTQQQTWLLAPEREELQESRRPASYDTSQAVFPPAENTTAASTEGANDALKSGDSMQRFVDECCIVCSDEASTAKNLYIAYLRWCDENSQGPSLQRNFGTALSELGFHRRRRGQGRH